MAPKSRIHRIVDLRSRSRHAASNERVSGICSSGFLKVTPARPRRSTPQPERASVTYCRTQGIEHLLMLRTRAPVGPLDAALGAFPIPGLHMRPQADRTLQAVVGLDRYVPIVHHAIQRFVGIRLH